MQVKTKSVKQIVLKNIFNPLNIINLILAIAVFTTGSFQNMLFIGVSILNSAIGIFQEIRAKKTVDSLAILTEPKATLIVDGERKQVLLNELKKGDRIFLTSGNQIPADVRLCEGYVEVDESLITGESEYIGKKVDDTLLSGSLVVAGECEAIVETAGDECYVNQLTDKIKYIKPAKSELLRSINNIITAISISLAPIGAGLLIKEFVFNHNDYSTAVVSTTGALIGMIPEGLVLLTSLVLALGAVKLARHNTLVQDLYSIEGLARVDVICLDKTGTITEGKMKVDVIEELKKGEDYERYLAILLSATKAGNATFDALKERINVDITLDNGNKIVKNTPFSSKLKYSDVTLENGTILTLGAPEVITKDELVLAKAHEYSMKGMRVILFKKNDDNLALITIRDNVKKSAPATLAYFRKQDVRLIILSGDNPETVLAVANEAGFNEKSAVDARTIDNKDIPKVIKENNIFGRVTPEQKLAFVKELKKQGHTVAMTGDGINDTMALKEADTSIAMAGGSDAVRAVAQLVLLDSDFKSLPKILQEGRRSINNLQRSATLFLVKALFTAILAIIFIFLPMSYPFVPIQYTVVTAFTIGIPSFFLALEPNDERVKGKFVSNVLLRSIPGTISMVASVMFIVLLSLIIPMTAAELSTVCIFTMATCGMIVLFRLCYPFTWLRGAVFFVLAPAVFVTIILAMYIMPDFLLLEPFTVSIALSLPFTISFSIVSYIGMILLRNYIAKVPAAEPRKKRRRR